MHYGQTTTSNDSVFQMIPPLLQPLRFWTPRVSSAIGNRTRRSADNKATGISLRAFTIKGGFVNLSSGERRMVIAGKIFKHQGM